MHPRKRRTGNNASRGAVRYSGEGFIVVTVAFLFSFYSNL
jgi:hypothetical protein